MVGGDKKNPKFKKIKWTNQPVKALGVLHGYNIDTDTIWLEKIQKIKSCLEVWKSRDLTYQGKVLLIKSLILSKIGFEIEMRGIPDKYKKEINDIIWAFIWSGKINQIKRDVCCLPVYEGGMGMINIDTFIQAKQIKSMHKILSSKEDTWNTIGKWWLKKLDEKFDAENFLANCSSLNGINIQNLPRYYQNILQGWAKFKSLHTPVSKQEILQQSLFGNNNIRFNGKPLFIQSFSKSRIQYIKDIWNDELNTLQNENYIFNKLQDKRNWISEWVKIKRSIPQNFIQLLKGEVPLQIQTNTCRNYFNIKDVYCLYNGQGKLIENKEFTLKSIQIALNSSNKVSPNCEMKWDIHFDTHLEWNKIWKKFYFNYASRKSNQLNWKIIHNIVYTEEKLQKMGRSDGKCHFCKTNSETLKHLFFGCDPINKLFGKIFHTINAFFTLENTETIYFNERHVIFGGYARNKRDCAIINTILNTVKWTIWKIRNIVKYQKKDFTSQLLTNAIKMELKNLMESINKDTLQGNAHINNINNIGNIASSNSFD